MRMRYKNIPFNTISWISWWFNTSLPVWQQYFSSTFLILLIEKIYTFYAWIWYSFWAPILECSRFNYNHVQVLWTFDSILHVYRLVSKCFFRYRFVVVVGVRFCIAITLQFSHWYVVNVWARLHSCDVHFFSFLLQFKCLNGFSYTVTFSQYPVVVFIFILFRCIVFERCCTWTTSSKERKKNQ